ncbi:hypothetical protein A0J57_11025 [Sphingobium sp. 22B]|nr:hypothetical protein A0J57_11025 [Sphingobium sp. 22B]OAP31823.1 hypothetical protein A8O16_10825 [Sphingobium sp. 20006FA]
MFPTVLAVELPMFAPVLAFQVTMELPMLPGGQALFMRLTMHFSQIIVFVIMLLIDLVVVVVMLRLCPTASRVGHCGGGNAQSQERGRRHQAKFTHSTSPSRVRPEIGRWR